MGSLRTGAAFSENILMERVPFCSLRKEGSKRVREAGDRSFFSVESNRNVPTDLIFSFVIPNCCEILSCTECIRSSTMSSDRAKKCWATSESRNALERAVRLSRPFRERLISHLPSNDCRWLGTRMRK